MASKKDLIEIGAGSYGKRLKSQEQKKMKGAIAGAITGIALAIISRQNLIVFGLGGLVAGRMLMD
tara:strand:+ start:83 stop:277 length:195 start_codon:yes stop_codon:yes gene_type:complete